MFAENAEIRIAFEKRFMNKRLNNKRQKQFLSLLNVLGYYL